MVKASIEVVRVGQAVVVGRPDVDRDALALARASRPERGRTTVVVGASAAEAVAAIDPWVIADLTESVTGSLRLVAPDLAVTGEDESWPPARLLSELFGAEVVVPERMPHALLDGSLFIPGSGESWVAYRSGGQPIRLGPRLPASPWQQHLPVSLPENVSQIPLGLWVRAAGSQPRPDDQLTGQVPDPDRMYVVVGAPGEPSPAPEAVAGVLRALTDEGRDRAVLAPYGCPGLAGAVANLLGRPVRMAHGVPFDGRPVVVDESGRREWRPFAVESVFRPGLAPVLDRWVAPGPEMVLTGPGSYRLAEGWVADVVPRGVLVRPQSLVPEAEWETGAGPGAELVLASDREMTATVAGAVDELIRTLPEDARASLRIVPVTPAAAQTARRLEAVDRVVWLGAMEAERENQTEAPVAATAELENMTPAVGMVVTADGRLLPAEPIATGSSSDFRPPAGAASIGVPAEPLEPEGFVPTAGESQPHHVPGPNLTPVTLPPRQAQAPEQIPSLIESALSPEVAVANPTASAGTPVSMKPSDIAAPARPGSPPMSRVRVGGPALTPPGPAHRDVSAATPLGRIVPVESGQDTPGVVRGSESLPPLVASAESCAPEPSEPTNVATPEAGTTPTPPAQAPLTTARPLVEVPADARSTHEQRKNVRAGLGSRYDVATRAVTKLLSERPGLRANRGEEGALLAELAAVRVFGEDPCGAYDTDFHVCLTSGLRRLPTVRTVVVRGVPDGTAFSPDAVLRLREPLVAASADSPGAVGGAEALIWATTARRLHGLVYEAGPDHLDVSGDVVLPGQTRLRVLGVENGPVRRILLAEEGSGGEEVLARLRAVAQERAAADSDRGPTTSDRWYGPLPAA